MAKSRDTHVQGALVQIAGDEYRISGEVDAAEIQRVAIFVDRKMQEVAGRSGTRNEKAVAVLAAMEIAAELLRTRADGEQLLQKTQDGIDRLSQLVDQRASLAPLTSEWLKRRLGQRLPT
ncbi:MAG: cell division protein ZapA [Candidatus Latescibacterota bacterium]